MSSARPPSSHPTLYEIFTRIWLGDLSRAAGSPVTLATVPDAALDRLAALGFDYVYLMGVWTLGEEGPRISRTDPELRLDYDLSLHGWKDEDVVGSPFAVARYAVDPAFGGDEALASLRARLAARGIGLLLDFVPNHVARDHHWVSEKPGLFVRDAQGALAPGKDPYFAPWKDTAQLDVRLPERLPDLPAAPLEPKDAEQTAIEEVEDVDQKQRVQDVAAIGLCSVAGQVTL